MLARFNIFRVPGLFVALVLCAWAQAGENQAERQIGQGAAGVILAQAASPLPSSPATGSNSGNPLSVLQQLSQGLLGAQDEDFLDPDQAFVLVAQPRGPDRVGLDWEIAEGYYLYRKRFDVELTEGAGLTLGGLEMAKGKVKQDEYFGAVEVYYGQASIQVPLIRAAAGNGPGTAKLAAATSLTLNVKYQGCADAGLCYPPISKTVSLELPPAARGARGDGGSTRTAALPGAAALAPPEQDRIVAAMVGGSTPWVLLSFFGFGLLLTFTPCVLPMIPILSGIIIGQGDAVSTSKAFRLSLTYVLAMAVAYTGVGVAAGLSGAGLQAAFQDPWVLSVFAAVFVLLALSMFGFYELQVPAFLQERLTSLSNSQRGGTYAGVAIMGLASALIVGPCIAPPLAGALIYIGQTGDALLGGSALFALSMGMGVPLLIVGTSAGRLVPRAGAWMDTIKAVFGVVLLGVAIYLLERVLPSWVSLLLWAALLIVVAIYLGALESIPAGASGWRRLWKGAGLVMLVYGVLLMVGASSGGGSLIRPLQGMLAAGPGAAHRELEFRRVKGPEGLQAALLEASAQGRSVMLDYYADWCVSCKEMEAFTFSDPAVQTALANTMLLQADVTANDEQDKALLKRFQLFGPPAILFFGDDGRERPQFRVVGYMNAEEFKRVVELATLPGEARRAGLAVGPRQGT